jgi:hypothetical protein
MFLRFIRIPRHVTAGCGMTRTLSTPGLSAGAGWPDRGTVLGLRPMSQINTSRPARLGFPVGCWGSRDGLRHGRSLWRPPWQNPAYLARLSPTECCTSSQPDNPGLALASPRGAYRSVSGRPGRPRPRAHDTGSSHACAVELPTEDQVPRLVPLVISRWIRLWITLWIALGI